MKINRGLFLVFISLVFILNFISAVELELTQEYLFLTGEWTSSSDLKIDEMNVIIKNIGETSESFPFYNLEAGEYRNFVVCGEKNCINESEEQNRRVDL
jgi:hypothetical protein